MGRRHWSEVILFSHIFDDTREFRFLEINERTPSALDELQEVVRWSAAEMFKFHFQSTSRLWFTYQTFRRWIGVTG